MEGPPGQTEAVHGNGGDGIVGDLEFDAGMNGPALIFGHGKDGAGDQILQFLLGKLHGTAAVDVGQLGVILGRLGGDGEGSVTGADGDFVILPHHHGDGTFRQAADDIAEELGRQNALAGVGNVGVDVVSDGGFHIITRQTQSDFRPAQDAFDDGKAALLSHRSASDIQSCYQHAFFTGKAHSQVPFLFKRSGYLSLS